MRFFSLDARLSLCAEFVRSGSRIADIGTDHAYLPVHLILSGKIPSAIAADIGAEPLKSGTETVVRYELQDKISLRLSDGLQGISPEEVDDIVIAGMGGETIIGILERAPWIHDRRLRLILQPMTKAHLVVEFLCKEGFEITMQKACETGDKVYTVIAASYTGTAHTPEEIFTYMGRLNPTSEPADRKYLEGQIRMLKKQGMGDSRYTLLADQITERLENL